MIMMTTETTNSTTTKSLIEEATATIETKGSIADPSVAAKTNLHTGLLDPPSEAPKPDLTGAFPAKKPWEDKEVILAAIDAALKISQMFAGARNQESLATLKKVAYLAKKRGYKI
jgi:hypothetical protein